MKPSIPSGTRDFGPAEMQKRKHILDTLRKNFELFGFQAIETPAMENITTLTGKYGEEGDQLIYKILNSRIHESKKKDLLLSEFKLALESSRNSTELTEKALRYDLTVPFARFVVMNRNELVFPFRRYQVQPVWRADRPQKGRYREFYQCDADCIGSDSLSNELDLMALMEKSFAELRIPAVLKINNRKILSALAEVLGEKDKLTAITVALDKLDKIGKDKVKAELTGKGLSPEAIGKLEPIMEFQGDNAGKLSLLGEILGENESAKKGLEELRYLLQHGKTTWLRTELDITLARGLNYYTGSIFEVKASEGSLQSSILGGGRYDDLTGVFGLPDTSGVGISFGIDRIYDVMEELGLFPESARKASSSTLLLAHFDEATHLHCMEMASMLRHENIACEVYPDSGKKLARQFDYANRKNIPFVCPVGSREMESLNYTLKNMNSGEQFQLNRTELLSHLKNGYGIQH
ncbi:MAG TPA: histidine--tRNA ligase [Bacteroidia bacterium]|nr:histidine--tRNA ligase [Bacteroidia bacterium]